MDIYERRDTLVRLLRRRHHWTVGDLARELGVSGRTVLRDLDALRVRGYDVRATAGPGGGVRLDPRSVLVSSQLASSEVVALVLSVAVARAARGLPFASGAERALAKIEGALPAARLEELERVRARILVGDPTGATPDEDVDPALLATFEQAFTAGNVLLFAYVDRGGRRSERRAEPHGLLIRTPLSYVIAWDLDEEAPRLFRLDRIHDLRLSEESILFRPFDLVTGVCPDARIPPVRVTSSSASSSDMALADRFRSL